MGSVVCFPFDVVEYVGRVRDGAGDIAKYAGLGAVILSMLAGGIILIKKYVLEI